MGLRGWSGGMREISLSFLFFPFFFVSSSRVQVVMLDRFWRSIHQNVRSRVRKCLLGVWIIKIYIYSLFSPKFENLHYGLWGFRTAITRTPLKIDARCLHQVGVFGVGQFNGVVEICPRPTLVTMVTKWLFLNTKLVITQLMYEISPKFLHQTGGFRGGAI